MDYIGVTFENCIVDLDTNRFDDCAFRDVVFRYCGGACSISNCEFNAMPMFAFEGALGAGLDWLRKFARSAGAEAVDYYASSLAEAIRGEPRVN